MPVIPFPPPPPPPESRDPFPSHYDGIPAFDLVDLTEDQLATLAMMGLSQADIVDRSILLYLVEAKPDGAGLPAIAPTHVVRSHNPVVVHRGKRKAISPNGDITTLSREDEEYG